MTYWNILDMKLDHNFSSLITCCCYLKCSVLVEPCNKLGFSYNDLFLLGREPWWLTLSVSFSMPIGCVAGFFPKKIWKSIQVSKAKHLMHTLIHRLQTVSSVKTKTPLDYPGAPEKYIFPYTKKSVCCYFLAYIKQPIALCNLDCFFFCCVLGWWFQWFSLNNLKPFLWSLPWTKTPLGTYTWAWVGCFFAPRPTNLHLC